MSEATIPVPYMSTDRRGFLGALAALVAARAGWRDFGAGTPATLHGADQVVPLPGDVTPAWVTAELRWALETELSERGR